MYRVFKLYNMVGTNQEFNLLESRSEILRLCISLNITKQNMQLMKICLYTWFICGKSADHIV